MAEETIRIRARASMAQAALRLANEAQASFRENLRAELDKIDRDTEKKLEAFRRQQVYSNTSEQNGNHQPGYDGGIVSMLLGANADILLQYHILREDEINRTRLKEHDNSSTVTGQDNRDDPSLHSLGESVLNISSGSSSDPFLSASYPESEDIKGWLKESDGKEENKILSQQVISNPNPSGTTVPSLAPDTFSRVSTNSSIQVQSSSRQDSSKQEPCQQKTNGQKSISMSDEAEKAQEKKKQFSDASDSDVLPSHRRIHSKSHFHVDKGKGVDANPDPHRVCSFVPPVPASQPAGASKNPIDLNKGPKKEMIPNPRCSPELAMTKKVDKGPENLLKSTTPHPPIIPAGPPVRPVISQPTNVQKSAAMIIKLKVPEKDRSSDPRNLPFRPVSASQPATTSKGRAGLEKIKVPEKKPSSTPRGSFVIPGVPLVRPAASQPATSNKSPVKAEKGEIPDKKPNPTPRRFLVGPVSASQPTTGSKRARASSPQTPEHFNSFEESQQSTRRRQPPRNSVTPVPTYNIRRKFRNMVGTLEGPEYHLL
ncbi:hypothetical protein F4782DRAFT_547067 [Xylaria castorea]|nr:hypothetical protein F4782DRAFT_547067 [Xylaria castorea]